MNVIINGKNTKIEPKTSLSDILLSMQLAKSGIVVELNKEAVFPRNYETTLLHKGDQIEIVAISAGG